MTLSAQKQLEEDPIIPAPYNPDVDGDGLITVSDVLEVISIFSDEFEPDVIPVTNLSGANLNSIVPFMEPDLFFILSYTNLSHANLNNADLHHADFSNSNLYSVDFALASLSSANLSYANLSYAFLYDAYLGSTNLSYANLSYANLLNANLLNADLSGANLDGVTWTGAYIEGCNGCNCIDDDGDNYCD